MPTRLGRGYVRLLLDSSSGEWKALSLFTMVDAIKGYEELGPEDGTYGGHTLSWDEVIDERRAQTERDPYVLIMGAGQSGLNVAARFKQMGIPTVVVEKEKRVGDVWRKRYPTLSLHSIRNHHTLLYQPYPNTWPQFTPGHKLADWLEQYAISQELIVWTNSFVMPTPTYDYVNKKWTATISRNGTEIVLHPGHIVSAIGSTGPPRVPELPGRELFQGTVLHSSEYKGGHAFTGKHTVVVGACASAADICQDVAFRGSASCTMVQRSSTCVLSLNTSMRTEGAMYPDNVPLDICDFKNSSLPLNLSRKFAKEEEAITLEREKELHTKLRNSGFKLNMGTDGSGYIFLIYERLGGSWRDRGLSDYFENGKVKVKQGVEVKRFTRNGVVFTDDTEMQADAVVFATGYYDPRESLRTMFGADVIDQTEQAWGIDQEGEIRGCFRPTGHPALWYGAGDFATSRFYSKQLGILIQASQLGLISASA
ncbi:FAD/NAD(P)-binding domain-containing protein [Wolfiporia cocos MD-104 SS10]|uniref:FAD/NAD(P)-binding domain-containing protein n=1 Tax=Wolfiporia cocos (strain MD-104) TaxID=742152 RepID=A0A2H3J1T4_WOLCO|nr:FAD/NAD(P)-binding domain-containing protein [Wolfiporia cocos MD-104 SS10]